MSSLLSIDGAFGEGGGQIIRTAVSLSAITGRPVEVFNARARRNKPGLQPQHLAAVRAAASICGASVTGGSVGSVHFRFEPGHPVTAGDYHFDVGTAGAAPLVVQTVLLPLALAAGASTVRILGGTHVPFAPTAEYLECVYFPTLRELGLEVEFAYSSAGFYPRGGGVVTVRIGGFGKVDSLDWRKRGAVQDVRAHIVTANLSDDVAMRGAHTVEEATRSIRPGVHVETRKKSSLGPGAAVILSVSCGSGRAGFSAVGARKLPMEKVAAHPAKNSFAGCNRARLATSISPTNWSCHSPSPVVPAIGRHRSSPSICTP